MKARTSRRIKFCRLCGKPAPSYARNALCIKHTAESVRRVRHYRESLGLCSFCTTPALAGKRLCKKHSAINLKACANYREKKQERRGWKMQRVKV